MAGEIVPLGRMPTPSAGDQGMSGPVRLEVYQSGSAGRDALDTVCLTPHGFDMTHVDAVGHSFFAGRAYNENWRDHVFSPNGLRSGGVDALAGGIVTRGVLLDVAGQKGVEALDPGEGISGEDLDSAERAAGAEVMAGDAVFVRAGTGGRGPGPDGRRAGLLGVAVEWLHRRCVSVYSGDCIERLPGDDPEVPMVLHQVGHVAMGLAILDNPDVEALRAACHRHGRNSFLLMVGVLGLEGATGCAVNPLAVF